MRNKWTPFPDDMPEQERHWPVLFGRRRHRALLTLRGEDGRYHVGFYPAWKCTTLAYTGIYPSSEDREGWKSEFWGDELPEKSDWYLVTVEGRHGDELEKSWFDAEKYRWCRERGRPEVVAWRELPKPWRPKEERK